MAVFKPFRGVSPTRERASSVAAPPYDVVNTQEAAEIAEGNPLCFLRVARPEIELPPETDIHSDAVYAKAAENYKRLKETAPLTQDDEARIYVYALTMDGRTQVGLVGAASTADYNADVIKKHEKTREEKEDDRMAHIMATRSHTGPVFLTYKDSDAVNALVATTMKAAPNFDFTAPDGITHRLWKTNTETSGKLSALFAEIPELYIADGHHRAAAASRVAKELAEKNPNHTGEEDYNFFLTVAFPAAQLRILPYNRVTLDLNGLGKTEFLKAVENAGFALSKADSPKAETTGDIRMYIDGEWYAIKSKKSAPSDPAEALDVSVLQRGLLEPVLGIENPRTSNRIDFIGGIRGTVELERLVDSGKAAVAFSLYPVTVESLMAISDAGGIMPPKSTWFEPKLRDGLVCHDF
jgi:uncharacterized protein (DUF1015 family)